MKEVSFSSRESERSWKFSGYLGNRNVDLRSVRYVTGWLYSHLNHTLLCFSPIKSLFCLCLFFSASFTSSLILWIKLFIVDFWQLLSCLTNRFRKQTFKSLLWISCYVMAVMLCESRLPAQRTGIPLLGSWSLWGLPQKFAPWAVLNRKTWFPFPGESHLLCVCLRQRAWHQLFARAQDEVWTGQWSSAL